MRSDSLTARQSWRLIQASPDLSDDLLFGGSLERLRQLRRILFYCAA